MNLHGFDSIESVPTPVRICSPHSKLRGDAPAHGNVPCSFIRFLHREDILSHYSVEAWNIP